MINSFEILSWDEIPINYIAKNLKGKIPEKIEFKEGLNILVGNNGSGKTSILKLLKLITFCFKEYHSVLDYKDSIKYFYKKFDSDKISIGYRVVSDFTKPVFNLRDNSELDDRNQFSSLYNFYQTFNKLNFSTGESQWESVCKLFNDMFDESFNYSLDLDKLPEEIREYIKVNQKDSDVYTIIMDEPDKNLDIYKVKELYDVFKDVRKDTQFIISLHNPLLIYKLRNFANFIELTDNYINNIINFVEND